MSFFDIAAPLAQRGFRVFPNVPGKKFPFKLSEGDHFDAATTDLEQLKEWDAQAPNANVGLSPDEHFCFFETDSETECLAKAAAAGVLPETWTGPRVSSGRPERAYYIFRQTERSRRAGNLVAKSSVILPGATVPDNLFEFKQFRTLVVGPGSIHPKTGKPYVAEWRDGIIRAIPDALINFMLTAANKAPVGQSGEMDAETERQTALLDKFLEIYGLATDGGWRHKGKQWYRNVTCPWVATHDNPNEGSSTCIVYSEDSGRYGFDCKHKCSDKDWKAFRAEVEARFPDRKFSFVKVPAARIGGVEDTEPERPAPLYPIGEWDGTEFGEYANLCADDNNIPRKMFVETFRTVTGAIVGDMLSCPIESVNPRSYTVEIAPPGKGKGTSMERTVQFYSHGSIMPAPLLFEGEKSTWRRHGLGAEIGVAASSPGLMNLITPPPLPAPKGKTEEEKAASKRQIEEEAARWAWRPMARILSMAEEAKEMLANLYTENGVGTQLEGTICTLWDHTRFTTTSTKDRKHSVSRVLLSVLIGVTPDDWEDLLSRGQAMGSGFMSRLNIVGTRGLWANVSDMTMPNFAPLRARLLPRIHALKDTPANIGRTDAARGIVREWFAALKTDGRSESRFNLHAWRSALWLAWLKGHADITEADAKSGIALAQYQWDTRDWYTVTQVENPVARTQEKMRKALRGVRYTRNELYRKINGARVGTEIFNRALKGLMDAGEIVASKEAIPEYRLTRLK